MKILQINLNKSRGAQDLMLQYMYEKKAGIALISEPNKIPRGNWVEDTKGLAAVHWGREEPCALVRRGKGYVMIEWGEYKIISVYCSPNEKRDVFEKLLEDIGECIGKHRGNKVIVGGDMNARSKMWDRRYNYRGYLLEEWADSKGLLVLNDGRADTCVRAQGSSRVDITLATVAAAKETRGWEVDGITETLSDHKYVTYRIGGKDLGEMGNRGNIFPRWSTKKCEVEWFDGSVAWSAWLSEQKIGELIRIGESEKADLLLKRILTDACYNSMGRKKTRGGGETKYIGGIRK